MKIFQFIPGFRSKTKWKMIIATLYYLFALLSFAGGFWAGIFFLSSPFFVFSLIDVIRYKKKSMPIGNSLIVLIISLALLTTSITAIPSPNQNASSESIVATQQNQTNQVSQPAQTTTSQPQSQNVDTSSNQNSSVTQTPPIPSQPSQTQEANNEQEKESPIPLVAVKVTKVIDGDTFYVKFKDGTEEKVRLIGVDTPESTIQHEPYGEEASSFTKERLEGKEIYLEKDVSETDKYGRLLRYVWLEPPDKISEDEIRTKMFNAILLLEGYAQVATYPPDVKYVDYFTTFQEEARNADKGLWAIDSSSTTTLVSDENSSIESSSSSAQEDRIVYWTPRGKSYHFSKSCPTLSRSKTILEGPLSECPKTDPCDRCAY